MIHTVTYTADRITISRKEALARLAYPVKDPEQRVLDRMAAAEKEIKSCADFRACYVRLPLTLSEDFAEIAGLRLESRRLRELLSDCKEVFVFAATIGAAVDRLISKKMVLSTADALVTDAMASSTIEALCDRLNRDIGAGLVTTRRYSPGYGDFSLSLQSSVLGLLDAKKKIGVSLTESNLMVPTKSVTAIIGIKGETSHEHS